MPLPRLCLADMPPLGYVGPAPVSSTVPVTSPVAAATMPPLGYVGPVPSSGVPLSFPTMPPLGYIGPVPHGNAPVQPVAVVPIVATTPKPVPKPVMPVAEVSKSTPTPTLIEPQGVKTAVTAVPVTSNVTVNNFPTVPLAAWHAPAPMPLGYTGAVPHSDSAPVAPPPPANTDDIANAHTGETLITANRMHSDSTTGITTATGKVEIVRGDYVLHADKVIYNQKTGIMIADGHVAMLTPSGDVEFATHEEVTGDMKQAFIEQIGILFPDNSRMAGVTGSRYDERYTVIDKAMYTACNICRENPDNPPLWQLRADSITHDNVEHEVYYHNAVIDFAGLPVAYTPYISAPDPTVKRRQGFLSPEPGYSPNIGEYIKTPYYLDIAPDKDMTLTPTFSSTDKAQLDAQYRERFAQGKLQLEGSVTHADLISDTGQDEGQQWRGHLFGTFIYDIDDTWRVGTDAQYVSDKSYLQRYQISSLDQATTHAFAEGFRGRNYMSFNSYSFEDLRPDTGAAEPFVLPSMQFSALGDPGQTLGGRWSLDGNTLITTRDNSGKPITQQGPDTRRLSLNAGWQRQMISETGLETTVSGLFRTDSYWANNIVAADGSSDVYSHTAFTRQFEQANAVFRYPLGRSGDGYQHLLEPIVALTAAPDVRQIAAQPNEDSLDTEFDETNLFSPNRFTGSDLIEGGSRVTYGVRNAITADEGARIDIFGGESYDFTTNNQFPSESGLNGHASDYVGRIDFEPAKWVTMNYGFRLAQSNLSPQQQDALLSVGAPIFRPSVRYIQAYQTDTTTGLFDQVREATFGFSSTFAKYWTLGGSYVQGFDPQPGPRNSSLTLNYVDECFAAGITLSENNTSRVDLSSGTSAVFHIYLKNLGGAGTDSTANVSFPEKFRQLPQ